LSDAYFRLADKFSEDVVPLSDSEKDFYAGRFDADLVAKAKAAFNFGEQESITKKDLQRRYRQILMRIHPDKNGGQLHPCHHNIIALFCILLTHVEGRADEIELPEIMKLTAEALDRSLPSAYRCLELLRFSRHPDSFEQALLDSSCQKLQNGVKLLVESEDYEQALSALCNRKIGHTDVVTYSHCVPRILDAIKASCSHKDNVKLKSREPLLYLDGSTQIPVKNSFLDEFIGDASSSQSRHRRSRSR